MKKITLLAALFAAFTMNAQIFFDDFNTEVVDATTYANWTALDEDGDGFFWEVFDADATGYPWLMSGLGTDSDSWEGGTPLSPDNYLITSDPIDLSGSTGTTITYLVGTYQTDGNFIDDKYSIYMSTSNAVLDILAETPIATKLVSDDVTAIAGDGSDSAAQVTVDASAYDGQLVYLTFRHYDSVDINSVLLDDISVDGTLSVGDETFNGFDYFIDANNQLNLRANAPLESVQLFNILGQQVVTQKLAAQSEVIDISSLNTGVYIATINIDGQKKSFKIIKR